MTRRVWVTGASEGIGRATAERFARAGDAIAVCARRPGPLENLPRDLRAIGAASVVAFVGDVSLEGDLVGFAQAAEAGLGGCDVLVNGVGGGGPGTVLGGGDTAFHEDFAYAFAVNVLAPARLARLAQVHLRASRGVVVNVSSAWAKAPMGITPASYTVTKAALDALTAQLAREFGPAGVRVVGVAPGPVWTESWDRDAQRQAASEARPLDDVVAETYGETGEATTLGRPARPAEVAAAIYWLASAEAAYVTGATVPVDGGYLVRER